MKYLSLEEFKTLLRSCPENKPWQRAMFLTMFWHGCRISETVGPKGLLGRHIQHGYVDINRLKGSQHTVQPYVFHPDAELDESGPLTLLAAQVGLDEPVFPLSVRGVQDLMVRISQRTGLNRLKMHPHALKHTHAMQSIKAGVGIEVIRETLGHKSLSSTGFYTRIAQDDAMKTVAQAIGGGTMWSSE